MWAAKYIYIYIFFSIHSDLSCHHRPSGLQLRGNKYFHNKKGMYNIIRLLDRLGYASLFSISSLFLFSWAVLYFQTGNVISLLRGFLTMYKSEENHTTQRHFSDLQPVRKITTKKKHRLSHQFETIFWPRIDTLYRFLSICIIYAYLSYMCTVFFY